MKPTGVESSQTIMSSLNHPVVLINLINSEFLCATFKTLSRKPKVVIFSYTKPCIRIGTVLQSRLLLVLGSFYSNRFMVLPLF